MKKQAEFLNYLDELNATVAPLFDGEDLMNTLKSLRNDVKNAQLLVPVIGGFSAGKSTLINAFLGKKYLAENVSAETALATELYYCEDEKNEKIVAVRQNGQEETFAIDAGETLKANANQYQYVRYYINSQKLKEIEPLVLVDMPGFGASNDAHHTAIDQYLVKDAHFIVLTSVDRGTMESSLKNKIQNLEDFAKGFTFCLSKTNLRSPNEVREVKEKLQSDLDDYFFGREINEIVELNDNGGENLKKILQGIDPDKFFSAIFLEKLQENNQQFQNNLATKLASTKLDEDKLKDAIKEFDDGIKKLGNERDDILGSLETNNADDIQSIINRVKGDVLNQASYLASLALRNQEQCKDQLNSIVRNTLEREVKERVRKRGAAAIKKFSHIANDVLSSGLGNIQMDSVQINAMLDRKIVDNDDLDLGDAIKAVASLASLVFGGLPAIIGKILNALPIVSNVINFFFGSNKAQEERDPQQEVENKIRGDVVRQIENELNGRLPSIFNDAIRGMINDVDKEFKTLISNHKQSIEGELNQQRKNDADKLALHIANLEKAQAKVAELAKALN